MVTTLLKMDGKYVLIDPVFSERASPVQWMGPKRFHATPISIEALPKLSVLIISHDHYDHLDKASVEMLESKTGQFIVPLKVGNHLRDWGIAQDKITSLADENNVPICVPIFGEILPIKQASAAPNKRWWVEG
ncbi:hypothetical protein MTsDn1_00180 [Alteromonas sp. MTD1]|uniref:MBL fold metallo-hydrolase n=1 Tax=Alteromonas sp. MTD1 TaxID=3057962 RepID=UPI0036F1C6F9